MRTYSIYTYKTGVFSGTLNPEKMLEVLNEHASRGWTLSRTIRERRRVWLFFSREAHFLIFEKEAE